MFKRLLLLLTVLAFLTGSLSALAGDELRYAIEVDVANQITTIYRTSDHSIVRQMICSTGLNDYTPLGVFRLEEPHPDTDRVEWYYITKYRCFVKYATRIKGSILFHSLPYAEREMSSIDLDAQAQLGEKASHGCIRLHWEDAQWIAEHCPRGTLVTIFNGAAKKEALRQVLLDEGYARSGGQSYDEFLIATSADDNSFSIGRGSTGDVVTALQSRLCELGFLTGNATGIYDSATVVAVMRCQADYSLEVNGVASRGLMRLLDIAVPSSTAGSMEGVSGVDDPQPVPLFPITTDL